MAREINHVIEQLSKIEEASINILNNAEMEKKEYVALMEQKTKEFDKQLEEESRIRLDQLKKELNEKNEKTLAAWKSEMQEQLNCLDQRFEEKLPSLVKQIFERIVTI